MRNKNNFIEKLLAKFAGVLKPCDIKINSSTITGGSVHIHKGRILIDGEVYKTDDKIINIIVTGDVSDLKIDFCDKLEINGHVNRLNNRGECTVNGDVYGKVDNGVGKLTITGDVHNSINGGVGKISCRDVSGYVTTGVGKVTANVIKGNVETSMGTIKYNRKF